MTLSKLSTNSSSSYVLLMVDLDAPGGITNHTFSPFLHWLIPVSAASSEIPKGETSATPVAPYIGPAPPVGTGKHRYVFLLLSVPSPVFQWPESFPAFDAAKVESRILFDVEKFARAGGFQPVAANWFTTENITAVYTAGAPNSAKGFASAILGAGALLALVLTYI